MFKRLKNVTWLKAAIVRSVRTMAQTCLALLSSAMVLSDIDFGYVASATVLAGIYSLLTSLSGLPEVEEIEDKDNEDDN